MKLVISQTSFASWRGVSVGERGQMPIFACRRILYVDARYWAESLDHT